MTDLRNCVQHNVTEIVYIVRWEERGASEVCLSHRCDNGLDFKGCAVSRLLPDPATDRLEAVADVQVVWYWHGDMQDNART